MPCLAHAWKDHNSAMFTAKINWSTDNEMTTQFPGRGRRCRSTYQVMCKLKVLTGVKATAIYSFLLGWSVWPIWYKLLSFLSTLYQPEEPYHLQSEHQLTRDTPAHMCTQRHMKHSCQASEECFRLRMVSAPSPPSSIGLAPPLAFRL